MAEQSKSKGVSFRFTSPVIGAFPNLFEARKFRDQRGIESKEANFSIALLMRPDHPDLPSLKEALSVAAREEWGDISNMTIDWALKSGDALADKAKREGKNNEYFRGFLVLRASTGEKYPPGLGSLVNGAIRNVAPSGPERDVRKGEFFGGMDCLAEIQLKAYAVGNNTPGVKAYLQVVVSLGGEAKSELSGGGGRTAESSFSDYRGHVSATVDPTAGLSGLSNL